MPPSVMPGATVSPGAELGRPNARTALILAALAALVFAWGVPSEPVFPDETAYVTQSYFLDGLAITRRNDWAWLEYHAYDLPPLPKYVFGLAEKAAGHPVPDRRTAGRWFQNITRPLVSTAMIHAARWPVVGFGALGVAALYLLATVGAGERVGVVAALLLIVDPLYRLHSRRAMSDVPAEAFTLAAEAVALIAWRGMLERGMGVARFLGLFALSGLLLGLATLSKLTGLSALLVMGALSVLAQVVGRAAGWRRAGFALGTIVAAAVALGTWLVLNPYLTAHPLGPPPADLIAPAAAEDGVAGRIERMLRHRVDVSRDAQENPRLRHDALPRLGDKVAAVAVQGFGRFGPLGRWDHDSTRPYPRFAWDRDAGAVLWLPCVLGGGVVLLLQGRGQLRSGRAPTAWALVVLGLLSTLTVLLFIPLAWDRYYLPIQAPAIIAGAALVVAVAGQLFPAGSNGTAP